MSLSLQLSRTGTDNLPSRPNPISDPTPKTASLGNTNREVIKLEPNKPNSSGISKKTLNKIAVAALVVVLAILAVIAAALISPWSPWAGAAIFYGTFFVPAAIGAFRSARQDGIR